MSVQDDLVVVGNCCTDVDRCKESEDEGLDNRDEDFEGHDKRRQDHWAHTQESASQHFVGGDYQKKTKSQCCRTNHKVEPLKRSNWLPEEKTDIVMAMSHYARNQLSNDGKTSKASSNVEISSGSSYFKVLTVDMGPPGHMLKHLVGKNANQVAG
jgi:hypothetical protein